MKKYLMSLLVLVLGIGMVYANPVSVSQAKFVGQQFVQTNFEQSRQSQDLTLVYTGSTTRGEASYYVFNVGHDGFVIVSADDNYRPIVGFSDEGCFDANNISPELAFYLNAIAEGRSKASVNAINPMVPVEWESLSNTGRLLSFNGGRGVDFLVKTKWNQNPAPYNSLCPADPLGPGGHDYVGCVATAMSQLMKYWNYPEKGQGSHSYQCLPRPGYAGHPEYGTLTANFGETTYDWANMLNSYGSNNYTPEEGLAVATICYHCGVSVNMMYGNNVDEGSGAYSEDVVSAIYNYFLYTNHASLQSYSASMVNQWKSMLKEQFDMGWPVYYAGSSSEGGHAFICDGYNDNDLFHFNFGWGGSGNGWFVVDQIDYNSNMRAIINFTPSEVYNNTAQAPTNFSVTPAANNELAATLSWVNPTKTLSNTNLSTIDQIVVCRDGEIVYVENNVNPGATMTITDNNVPRFDVFNYSVYAVCYGSHGKVAYQNDIVFGPSCGWTVNISQAAMNGFRGGMIHVYNASGHDVAQITTTSGGVQSIPVDVPLGNVSFGWSAQTYGDPFNMTFIIKDSQNTTVYTYSGNSSDLAEGIFYESNNNCGQSIGDGVPSNLVALVDEDNPNNINVSWDGIREDGYGYTVYRDGVLHRLIPNGTSFVDENVPQGGHCYYVGYMYDGGENGMYSNESCATSGACYAATNIDLEYTSSNKIKVKWERPEPSDGLSGYYVYRKFGEEGEYERVKQLGANATSYTDNSANQDGDYYYKLYAYYGELDCTSAPAYWIHDHNRFYLHAPYYTDGINEAEANSVAVFPNPTTSRFTIEAEGLNHVTVFNTMGQKVYEMSTQAESVDIDLNVETGIYMVRVSTANGEVTKRITVIR